MYLCILTMSISLQYVMIGKKLFDFINRNIEEQTSCLENPTKGIQLKYKID